MARADLHYALAIDREIHEAAKVDPALLDPVVRVDGGLPGLVRPFRVVRDYQGPVGTYTEYLILRDPDGRELARTAKQPIRLTGEMFENRFVSDLRNIELRTSEEHELAFLINDVEIATIPVFVETGTGGDPRIAAEETFKSAMKKGAIVWLVVPQPDGRKHEQPVWFVYDKGALFVLTGPSEQDVPNLTSVPEAEIIARSKDLRSQVSRVRATARIVETGSDEYERIIATALGKRLNLRSLEEAKERWRERCTLVELTPRFRSEREEAAVREAQAQQAASGPETAGQAPPAAKPADDEPKVEAGEIDQETYDKLIAEGKSERIARAKAKSAYVRKEKERLKADAAT